MIYVEVNSHTDLALKDPGAVMLTIHAEFLRRIGVRFFVTPIAKARWYIMNVLTYK